MNFAGSNQFEYIDGQLRPEHAALFEKIAADNDSALVEARPDLDISYGPHARQTFDLFRTTAPRRGVVGYFHAGYWQSRDKSGFRFLAPPLTADGFDVAIVNYPLSPEMEIGAIVSAAHGALAALAKLAGGKPLVLAGHSAGAQIAVELVMRGDADAQAVSGILALSGVFDLVPLIETSVNAKLGLDMASARAASPLHRVAAGAPKALFAVGAKETRAFQGQTAQMAQAWSQAGNAAEQLTIADADHFSILYALCREEGDLRRALRELVALAAAG